MEGKSKCRILKEIRKKIASENDIAYAVEECTYQGSCSGTCPKCEADLRYLEQELQKRQALGKAVTVAALAGAMMMGAVGCTPIEAEPTDVPQESSVVEFDGVPLETGDPSGR